MTAQEWTRLLNVQLTNEQARACRYLEMHSRLRFCIEFGYDNAVALAREHWKKRRKRRNEMHR